MPRWFESSGPLILGHRGASAFAPENTMAAFALAIAQGAVGIEFDVQVSRDGIPVIIHDNTVDRTTNGSGTVTAMTLAELKELDAGEGETIPTLDELFASFQDNILYNLEIKNDHLTDQAAEHHIAAVLASHKLAGTVLVSSFNFLALQRFHKLVGDAWPLATLWVEPPPEGIRRELKAAADHPHHKLIDATYMAWAKEADLVVNTWTVDQQEEAERLAGLGVCGIITNRPSDIKL